MEAQTSTVLPAIQETIQTVSVAQCRLSEEVSGLNQQAEQCSEETTRSLDEIQCSTKSTGHALVSMRDVLSYLAKIIQAIPEDMRRLVEMTTRTNLEIYQAARSIQAHLPVSNGPGLPLQDCILFEHALGCSRNLPYEFFQHFDFFETFLHHQFEGLPGERRVLAGHYMVVDSSLDNSLITRQDWTQMVFPGKRIAMSMLVEQLQERIKDSCPRSGCSGSLRRTGEGFRNWSVFNLRSVGMISGRAD